MAPPPSSAGRAGWRGLVVVHPWLFAVYPGLLLYGRNHSEVEPGAAGSAILWSLIAVSFIWAASALLLRSIGRADRHRPALLTSGLTVLTFTYGLARGIVGSLPAALAWIALGVLLWIFLARTRLTLSGASTVAAAVAAGLLLLALGDFLFALRSSTATRIEAEAGLTPRADGPREDRPDIYMIVVDGFGRADVLETIYGLESSDFTAALEARGFHVARQAVANYGRTGLSLASTLNISYLDRLAESVGPDSDDARPMFEALNSSVVVQFLRQRGYQIVTLDSGVPDAALTTADVTKATGPGSLFGELLLSLTPLPELRHRLGLADPAVGYRRRVMRLFELLERAPHIGRSPKLFYAHVPLPHPPFVFGAEGQNVSVDPVLQASDGSWLVKPGGLSRADYRLAYSGQLRYVARRITAAIDSILDRGQRPWIWLLSDHGPRSGLSWESAEETDHWESLSALSAFHGPVELTRRLYPGISHVNGFRVMLDASFGTRLGRLPDRCFYSTADRPWAFVEVTEQVKKGSR